MFQKFTLSLLVLISISYPTSAQVPSDDAIKGIISAETKAWNSKDSTAWEALWLQDPTTSITIIFAGGSRNWTGWDNIRPVAMAQLKNSSGTSVSTNDQYIIRKDANLASVDFRQATKRQGVDTATYTYEQRVLAKIKGKWKIVSFLSRSSDDGNSPAGIEASVNNAGYGLLAAGRTDDAIKLFIMNTQLFPDAWNTYDSLGEAYAIAGNKELARSNYEKSIQLNPKNENGKKALEKL